MLLYSQYSCGEECPRRTELQFAWILSSGSISATYRSTSRPHSPRTTTGWGLVPASGSQPAIACASLDYWMPWDKTSVRQSSELRLEVDHDKVDAAIGDTITVSVDVSAS